MKLICFDTEFSTLGVGPELISIGLVSVDDDSREFYAELTDTYSVEDCSDFVRAEVIPLLEGGDVRMTFDELGIRLKAWLEAFNEPVALCTDRPAHDWPWIQELFFREPGWPANLDGKPVLIQYRYLDDAERFNAAVERAYSSGRYRRHHALDDARVNAEGLRAAGTEYLTGVKSASDGMEFDAS